MKKILALTTLSAGMMVSMAANAGPLLTPAQTQGFSFATLDDSTSISFNGFDSSLGTLNSVHFTWTMDKTLNNKIINVSPSSQTIGVPSLVSATSTTTFSGPAGITDVNTLTTTGFTGPVPGSAVITTVGTASAPGLSGGVCLSNDASCGVGNTDLSSFIGGLNLFSISIANVGSQGGSVPPLVFTGNDGTANGTLSIVYDYTGKPPVTVAEPTSIAILGLGLAAMGFARRKSA